jgi:hypothetical protein
MTSNLGTLLILISWLYIVVAVVAGKTTYQEALRANPAYFSHQGDSRSDPFKTKEAQGVFGLVMDSAIGDKGFSPSLIKRIRLAQFLYYTAPVAFLSFLIGIIIR